MHSRTGWKSASTRCAASYSNAPARSCLTHLSKIFRSVFRKSDRFAPSRAPSDSNARTDRPHLLPGLAHRGLPKSPSDRHDRRLRHRGRVARFPPPGPLVPQWIGPANARLGAETDDLVNATHAAIPRRPESESLPPRRAPLRSSSQSRPDLRLLQRAEIPARPTTNCAQPSSFGVENLHRFGAGC